MEQLEIHFEPPTGEFEYFEIKRSDLAEELDERLDVFNAILAGIRRRHDRVKSDQDSEHAP
ncbi:MAG TPA: hypothetical protein ENN68_04340 [Methanomicrobia archaeon]|nr:hypothetical protein [Methanomicrobia archaeon]